MHLYNKHTFLDSDLNKVQPPIKITFFDIADLLF